MNAAIRRGLAQAAAAVLMCAWMATPCFAGLFFFSTGNVTDFMASATRPSTGGVSEIESADDFVLGSPTSLTSATFTGLIVSTGAATPTIGEVVVEIYRVFPADSDVNRTPQVPTRVNSPSDVAFDSRDSASSDLTFTTTTLATDFSALNSVQGPGGIDVNAGGDGPVRGTEVQFNVTFVHPFDLPANHYFFVPQVQVSGGEFLWLSGTRPIVPPGTPFTPDLQSWMRDQLLDPDWLRIGTDIVGAGTFNAAFTLNGTVPEPSTLLLVAIGAVALAGRLRRR